MSIVTRSTDTASQSVAYYRSDANTRYIGATAADTAETVTVATVDITLSQQARTADGQKALGTLTKIAAEAKLYPKQAAKQKLDAAVKQLQIIKLLGGLKGAKSLAQLAKQISSAAQDYASAEQDLAGQSGDGATQAAAPDAPQTAAATPTTDVKVPQEQDPFFAEADQALGEIQKALRKILPSIETSADGKTREAARKIRHDFNQSVSDTLSAETSFNAAEPAASAYEDATGLAADDPSLSSTAATAPASAPVDLTI